MDNSKYRYFHTNTFSDAAQYFFNDFIEYTKTGWLSRQMARAMSIATVERAPSGEVLIRVDVNSYSYRHSKWRELMNDADAMKWIASVLKPMALGVRGIAPSGYSFWRLNHNHKPIHEWKRNSTEITKELAGRTIGEVYMVYDFLANRSARCEKAYGEKFKKFLGVERDPIATEQETIRREELAKLEEEERQALVNLKKERDEKWSAFYHQLDKELAENIEKTKAEFTQKRKELNQTMALMCGMVA